MDFGSAYYNGFPSTKLNVSCWLIYFTQNSWIPKSHLRKTFQSSVHVRNNVLSPSERRYTRCAHDHFQGKKQNLLFSILSNKIIDSFSKEVIGHIIWFVQWLELTDLFVVTRMVFLFNGGGMI